MSANPQRSNRAVIWMALLTVLVAVGGYFVWKRGDSQQRTEKTSNPDAKPVDMVAVLRLNSRGVGEMLRFEKGYPLAAKTFEEVVQLAPDWTPGRINLAIAILNQSQGEQGRLEQALGLLKEVLQKEPENPYANHCTGIILDYQSRFEEAVHYFQAVLKVDPRDPHAWFYLGKAYQQTNNQDEAMKCFQRANELDPYLNGAIYQMAMGLRATDLEKAKTLLTEHTRLHDNLLDTPSGTKYTEFGKYGEAISSDSVSQPPPPVGPIPLFMPFDKLHVPLHSGARWAVAKDFGADDSAELRRMLRIRFGGTLVVLDYNRDGRPDVFLLGAVSEAGKVRDLLLRNDGDGKFTDVTAAAGLAGDWASVGCCVGDFDNDGHPDLLLTCVDGLRLFRNTGKGGFEDVTKKANLDTLRGVCLGAAFVDIDQDGDLDLCVARLAENVADALAILKGDKSKRGAGLAVFINKGEAPSANHEDPPPLEPGFRRFDSPAGLLGEPMPAVSLAVSDFDHDRDLDVLVFGERTPASVLLNDRLLRFNRRTLPEALLPPGTWNGALVLDADHDERADLVVIGPGQTPVLLLGRQEPGQADVTKWYKAGAVNSPPLIQAHAIDIDYDGWTDVIGLSEQRKPVLLHNDGMARLVQRSEALGVDKEWPTDLIGIAVADFDGDKYADLLLWSETGGLQLRRNLGNSNLAVKLNLTGHRKVEPDGYQVRTNAAGIGTWVTVHAADHHCSALYTTLSAGLGQSLQPLVLGLARHQQADIVRFRWPDNVIQAEFNTPGCRVTRIDQTNRKTTSCPIFFTWNGERFVFISDFLGAGSIGEAGADGHRPPRGEESVKVEAGQLAPLDGHYILKVAEPMSEVIYLDRLQLLVLDHPKEMRVYPDERFSSGPPPSQDLLAFRDEIYPAKATDHRGRDVTATLRQWDRDTVRQFARRTWLGFAEDHAVTLDFGDRLAKFGPKDRLVLCLAGWTDYPYPESIWAAGQAGVAMNVPVLEKLGDDGKWQTLHADLGFPAGLPKLMTRDVTGLLGGSRCVLRIRTNLNIYWDQIFVAPLVESVPAATPQTGKQVRVTPLEVGSANLAVRGCAQEYSPDGRQPTLYDHDRIESVPITPMAGKLTRLGDVTELLRGADDRFVILGPGDEVTARFDARKLPALPAGWARSFVLRTWGFSKDTGPFTAHNATIEPLPFRAMSNYPYGPNEKHPDEAYQRRYNTRQVGPRR